MSLSRLSFLIFMLACVCLMLRLGFWQIERLQWKEGLITEIEKVYASETSSLPIPAETAARLGEGQYLRGKFTGRIDSRFFYLKGQIDDGKQTEHLMLPLRLSDQVVVLIDMGPDAAPPKAQNGKITVTGLLRNAPKPNRFTPDNNPALKIWYSIDTQSLGIENLKPLVLIPETTPWKNFPPRKPEFRNDHLQYAIFWFTMAGLISLLTGYFLTRRNK